MADIKISPHNSYGKYALGRLFYTPSAGRSLKHEDVWMALKRHREGDWGDINEADRAWNEKALKAGKRLVSAYHDRNGTQFWIITEADRAVTTVLLPADY